MCTEIEAKLKVDSLQAVTERLAELGAEFVEEQLQKDCYFDNINNALLETDRGLRLRRQLIGQNEKMFLTYKGAMEKSQLKKRREIEIEVSDGGLAEKLFLALGYKKIISLEKNRRIWRLGECVVALDEVPLLGNFVEIEGSDEGKIADVQKNLGLSDLPAIKESYASLMQKKLCEAGKER